MSDSLKEVVTSLKPDKSSLLPCPFCGGEATMFSDDGLFNIYCDNDFCDVRPGIDTCFSEAEAVEAWNTRADRTCHNATHYAGKFKCSECGAILDTEDEEWEPTLWVDGVASYPSYCPNCGCRILEVDDD